VDYRWKTSNDCSGCFRSILEVAIPVFESPFVRAREGVASATETSSRGELLTLYAAQHRRCGTAFASAQDFIMRAKLSRALGDDPSALADVETALEREPADLESNLAAMRWGATKGRGAAAARVISGDGRDVSGLREAIRMRLDDGAGVVHRLRLSGSRIIGWLAWSSHGALTLGLKDSAGERMIDVAPDPLLAFAGEGFAIAEVELPDVWRVFDPQNDAVLFQRPSSTDFDDQRAAAPQDAAALCVIVPIYDGFEATQACLESLFLQLDIGFSTILVDDASPDSRLAALADLAALRPGVTLLRNDANLGFARSINRALAISGRDDVLLLNADTTLPPRAIARLHTLVASDPSVGTATPFSNNSQLTSFPRPFVVNGLPSGRLVEDIDEIAFAVNGGVLVDMPTGIGFCLYISRACLDATGPLPERYGRGYYEDAELCMIARQRGFRNVCATGIFVGHAGTISFKSDKSALVSRNLSILDDRFPGQGSEYLAFAQADPLRSARAAIEERLAPDLECTLILASEGRVLWQARERAKALCARGEASIILAFAPDGDRVDLRRAEEGAPASLTYMLDEPGRERLTIYLSRLNVRAVEMFDAARAPDSLINALFALGAPIDLFCVDLWAMRSGQTARLGACEAPLESQPCGSCVANYGTKSDAAPERARQARLALALSAARSVRSLDAIGAAFAKRIVSAKVQPCEPVIDTKPRRPPAASIADPRVLGVLAPVASVECERVLVRLSRRLARRGEGFRMVVLGVCFNEADVLAAGSAVVVRPSDPDDCVRLAQLYGVGRVALFDRTTLFGPLERLARQIGAPKAFFDWSFGALETSSADLAMDPRVCDEKAASAVAFWLNSD
jgi:GT2 family glycosyltransferase